MRAAGAALLFAAAILLAPCTADTQPGAKPFPRVGYLSGASESSREAAFREGLRELGYADGQNITVEYRFADGKNEKLPGFAAELVCLEVAVIVAATTPAIHAAQRATQTIPIVMTLGEPSQASITSLARPRGSTTGLSEFLLENLAGTGVENRDLLLTRVQVTSDECHDNGLLCVCAVALGLAEPSSSAGAFS